MLREEFRTGKIKTSRKHIHSVPNSTPPNCECTRGIVAHLPKVNCIQGGVDNQGSWLAANSPTSAE